jgi:ketosteroid isomerase-like protein
MSDNARTIERFYTAFQQRDHAAMAACYHPSIHFSDPAFGDLYGDEARAMWHMLCDRGADLEVTFNRVQANGDGSARWEARYSFAPTGRPVHNRIRSSFVFDDGQIIRHADVFDMWRWTRMALGATGVLTGWTWFTKNKVRQTARRSLDRFIDDHPEYAR